MFTAWWMAGACAALAVVALAIFRDRGRLGVSYCMEAAGAWGLSFVGAHIARLIAPYPMELWQLAAGLVAVYGCVLVVSAGRPAMLTAPYSEHARTGLSEVELRHWYRRGWVLTVAAVAITVSFAFAFA